MTTWYVRPDASHGGNNNGTSYVNAWQGWSSITFASMSAGDTLEIYGTHVYNSTILLNKAGSNLTIPTIFEGKENAILVFTDGFVQLNQSFVTLKNITIDSRVTDTSSIFMGNREGITLEDVILITTAKSSSAAITIQANSSQIATDHVYRRVSIQGSARTGIQWLCINGETATVNRMTFDSCDFSNCTQRGIEIRAEPTAAVGTSISNLKVENCIANNCGLIGFDLYQEYTLGENNGVIRGNNLIVRRNQANFCGYGASRIAGFGKTLPDWNIIEDNTFDYSLGPTGGINLFYSNDMTIRNNSCQHGRATNDAGSGIIDCNGILIDHFNYRTKVYNNNCSDNIGHPSHLNSGCAFMILDSEDTEIFNNIGNGCSVGLWTATADCLNSFVYNNTLTSCKRFGVRAENLLVGELILTNNIVSVSSGDVVHITSAVASITSTSNLFFGGRYLNFNPSVSDIEKDPNLELFSYFLSTTSPAISAVTYLGNLQDKNSSAFWNPPSIGAYKYIRPRAAALT